LSTPMYSIRRSESLESRIVSASRATDVTCTYGQPRTSRCRMFGTESANALIRLDVMFSVNLQSSYKIGK
jgi:hypothetical protein